jgi:ABC-type taurine transport system ATPase subunit
VLGDNGTGKTALLQVIALPLALATRQIQRVIDFDWLGNILDASYVFHQRVKVLFCNWINAIALVLMESGMDEKLAQQRAEDAAIAIQGSLILSQGLGDSSIFQRVIERLRHYHLTAKGVLVVGVEAQMPKTFLA